MKSLMIMVLSMVVCGGAMAQSTTAPATMPAQAQAGRRGGGLARGARGMTPAQQQAVMEWASQNMPDLARYAREASVGRGRFMLIGLMRARMQMMEEAPNDAIVRERLRRNIATENTIGQLLLELDDAPPQDHAKIMETIRLTMKQNVEGILAERQERIDRLRARLEMEQRSLEEDRQMIDQLVARRLMPFSNAIPGTETPPAPSESLNAAPIAPQTP